MSPAGRAGAVGVGLLLDRVLGEPVDRWHPVAWFGSAMGRVEGVLHDDRRLPGVLHALVGAGLGAAAGLALDRALGAALAPLTGPDSRPRIDTPGSHTATALAVSVASSGRLLRRTARDIEELLVAGDLDGARARLPWLVGRDPSQLDEPGVAAAVVESLAENTVDAVVAPAVWGLVAGAPGALTHRAVNTLDAMVGHRSPRHRHFGWASARLDDAMAWGPARAFAALVAVLSGRRLPLVLRVVARDSPAHPSPNAGVAESAVAAALRVKLGGPLRYGDRVELRPTLGDGPRPDATTIARARRLVDRVELVVVVLALLAATRQARRTSRERSA